MHPVVREEVVQLGFHVMLHLRHASPLESVLMEPVPMEVSAVKLITVAILHAERMVHVLADLYVIRQRMDVNQRYPVVREGHVRRAQCVMQKQKCVTRSFIAMRLAIVQLAVLAIPQAVLVKK